MCAMLNRFVAAIGSRRSIIATPWEKLVPQRFGKLFISQYRTSFTQDDDDDEPRRSNFKNRFRTENRGPRPSSFNVAHQYSGYQYSPLKAVDWNSTEMKEIVKNLYTESALTRDRPESEIKSFWDEHGITVITNDGKEPPNPTLTFEEIDFPSHIAKQIQREGFGKPTPIQAQSFATAMSGRNLVSIAQTGSGKTLGYMLPAIVHILKNKSQNSGNPRALVLAPTRELAQQIQRVASQFGATSNIRNACLFGGAGRTPQQQQLRRGVDITIATPGRLIDFLETGDISLKEISYCVLDEADRMLDMGFEPQIRKILSQVRPDRQMLMWSATWPDEVQQIAREFIENYVQINVGSVNLSANHNITQNIEIVDNYDKDNALMQLLQRLDDTKILIFSSTKRSCDRLNQFLNRQGLRSVVMHGDKSQTARDHALNLFRNDRAKILVATDVAARGLDVDGIGAVINYDFPQKTEDYVHRIGRTGRKDTKGASYTFLTEEDRRHARQLIEILQEANQEIDPEFLEWARNSRGGNSNSGKRFGGGFSRNNGNFKRNNGGRRFGNYNQEDNYNYRSY